MSILLAIVLFLVFFWIFWQLIQTKKDQQNVLTEFLHTEKKQSLTDWLTSPFANFSKWFMTKQKEEELQEKLDAAGMLITPQQFIRTKIAYPSIYATGFIFASVVNDYFLLKIGIIASLFMYFYPDINLKKRMRKAKLERKLELPRFLIPLAQFLKTHTTPQALLKARSAAGPYLSPYVDRLIAEIEAYPGSDLPFKNFAEKVDVPEAYTFIIALQQSMKTDSKQSLEIINDQIQMMRTLKNENFNYLMEIKPLEMDKFNVALIACMFLYPMVLVYLAIAQGFSNV